VNLRRSIDEPASWRLLPIAAALLAASIFAIDTFSPLGMAVAALYAIVVLMVANFSDRRGVIFASVACAALTLASFTISHGFNYESTAFVRGLVSLSAIAIAAILALKNKAAELALRRSEAYLAEAQRVSHTGSFGWNIAGQEMVWSEETYRIFEYEPSVTPGLELVFARTHPDDMATLRRAFAQAARDGRNWRLEHRLLMPGGQTKFVDVVAHSVTNAAGAVEFVGAIMDVTAAKKAKEDLEQARSNLAHVNRVSTLGEMTASISHEVSQPIAAIATNAGAGMRWLAAAAPNIEEGQAALARILKDANRASEVIARMRALAKKVPPRKDELPMNELILEVVALTRAEAEKARVAVETVLDNELPAIAGDRIQLQQVILNLVVNAIDAMAGGGGGPRELLIVSERDAADCITVQVKDTGPGIDAEHLQRLFEAFYTTKPHGLGLGLAICRSIIEAHDGRLWTEPNKVRGVTFHFSLPVDVQAR
jgi:signal transduction histidine kinase